MNITITPGAATEDATQIDSIVSTMQEDMETLDSAIKSTIPSGIQTTWSETVKENWESYYNADVPAAMEDMKQSAANLRLAVEEALQYDQEKK
jgi:hypothetical protein